MITEDYVSFETAKLLKEKGFLLPSTNFRDWVCCMYDENGDIQWGCYHTNWYARVTLQMAMKWLRETYWVDIEVRTHYLNYLKPNEIRYYAGKILKGSEDIIHTIYSKDTYEEVCEAAIKYCLENLI